jgi:hypothetical protein
MFASDEGEIEWTRASVPKADSERVYPEENFLDSAL